MAEEVIVYVSLFEEGGQPTIRRTVAIPQGNDLYRLLPTEHYDHVDEVWEFLPGAIVRCETKKGRDGTDYLLAVEEPGKLKTEELYVPVTRGAIKRRETRGIRRSDDLFEVLETSDYDPEYETWKFLPGSIVRCEKNSNNPFGPDYFDAIEQVTSPKTVCLFVPLIKGPVSERATQGLPQSNGVYKILPTPRYHPDYETWRFLPGSLVRCKARKGSTGEDYLVAVEQVK